MDEGMEEARRALEEAKTLQGRTALLAVQVRTALECLRRACDDLRDALEGRPSRYDGEEATMARSDWYDIEKDNTYEDGKSWSEEARGHLLDTVERPAEQNLATQKLYAIDELFDRVKALEAQLSDG